MNKSVETQYTIDEGTGLLRVKNRRDKVPSPKK